MKNFLLLIVFCTTFTFAQEKIWEKDLKKELHQVGWIKQSNEGNIIASGAKGFLALNSKNGEVIWHNKELKAVNKDTFLAIDGLPYIYLEYEPVVGKVRGIIMNSSTGEIIFDTKDNDYRIKGYTILKEQKVILFELLQDKEQKLMKFDIANAKVNWIVDLGKSGFFKKLIGNSFISHGPYFTKNNDLLIGVKDKIYAINFNSGGINWQHKAKKKIKALVYTPINNSLYLGIKNSNRLKVLNPNTGEDITPSKLKLRGTLIDVVSDPKTKELIVLETEGFNILNPETNKFKWKKSFKIYFLSEVISHEKGYIAVGKNEKQSVIALVSNEGKKIWDTDIKGYAYYANPTEQGVLYISTERANILNYEKGKDVWRRDVKFKSIPAVTFDDEEQKVILFENKKGYKFDLNTGEVNLFAEDIKLDGVKRKTPLKAEYIKGEGYLLNTDQHMSLLKPNGDVKYTSYYKPASSVGGLVGVAQIGLNLAGVDFDIKGSIDNINMLNNLSNGAYRTSSDQTDATKQSSEMAGLYVGDNKDNMQAVFSVTLDRYFNSKKTKDSQFIVTKIKRDDKPTIHKIIKVNKKTGAIDLEIDLLDKTPNYVIDVVDEKVFVNEKNKLISAYKF